MTQEKFINILREYSNFVNPTLLSILEADAGVFTDEIRAKIAEKIITAAGKMNDFYAAQFVNEQNLVQALDSLKKVSADMQKGYSDLLTLDSKAEAESASKEAESLIANL